METIFNRAERLMRAAEAAVMRRTQVAASPLLDSIFHLAWGSISFLMLGIESKVRIFALWFASAFCLLVLATFVMPAGMSENARAGVFYACQLIPTLFLAFALPSTFALRGVSQLAVTDVTTVIRKLAASSPQREALSGAVAVYQARAELRATSLKWLLGVFWAGISWYASKTVFSPSFPDASKSEAMGSIALCLLILAVTGLVIQGYAASVRILFQTIALSFANAGYAETEEQREREAPRSTENLN